MIGTIIELLETAKPTTEAIRIAKGENKLPENFKELSLKIKQVWHKRK